MRVVAVIPARLNSTRLPRKMLREIGGRPLVVCVYQAVRSSPLLDDVVVATDSDEILASCRLHSCNAQRTSDQHRSGTERVHEISLSIEADVYINVQGDEPMVRTEQIETLVELMRRPSIRVGTLKTVASREDIVSPNAVKVVTDATGRALYFSRATIPYDRDDSRPAYFKHLGLYAYRKETLESFVNLPESPLERAERLEQLRCLENGIPIYAAETPFDSVGVDTEEDLERVQKMLTR